MEAQPTYADVVERLAPCGLDCRRCVRYVDGDVKRHANALAKALEGFETMAPRAVGRLPVLAHYDGFAQILSMFGSADCTGCRSGGAPLPFCAARTCHREKGVDFCFQCGEYPCERNQFPEDLEARWRAYSDRMREVGAEQYCRESLEKPRY
jgi:hypothetical protein